MDTRYSVFLPPIGAGVESESPGSRVCSPNVDAASSIEPGDFPKVRTPDAEALPCLHITQICQQSERQSILNWRRGAP